MSRLESDSWSPSKEVMTSVVSAILEFENLMDTLSLAHRKCDIHKTRKMLLKSSNLEHIDQSLKQVVQFTELIRAGLDKNVETGNGPDFFKHFLKHNRLSASSEFIQAIESDDVIEANDIYHRQIFRNFRFIEICGYSLVEVLHYEWPELYERSQSITTNLLGHASQMIEGREFLPIETPEHYMKERFSEDRQVSRVKFKFGTNLISEYGEVVGYAATAKVRVVDDRPTDHKVRFV